VLYRGRAKIATFIVLSSCMVTEPCCFLVTLLKVESAFTYQKKKKEVESAF
jgi:hypothetical protein